MKLSQLTTEQAFNTLAAITPPLTRILKDPADPQSLFSTLHLADIETLKEFFSLPSVTLSSVVLSTVSSASALSRSSTHSRIVEVISI